MNDHTGPRPVPDPDKGPSDAARFQPCYRHGDRSTGISCQRCGRPICGECMRPASVGFQCPECVTAANEGVRKPRGGGQGSGVAPPSVGGFSPRLGFGAPVILAAVVAVLGIADLISGNQLTSLMAWSNAAAAQGQLWRALTWVLVSGSVFSLIINVLMILVIGSAVDAAVGGVRTVALYFLSGLGGAAAIALFGGPTGTGIGAGAALFGLLGANAALKYRQGADIRPDLILFGLLVVMNVVLASMAGSLSGVFGLVGGIVGGALGGVIIGWVPGGGHRERNQWLLLAGAALVCAALIGVGLAV